MKQLITTTILSLSLLTSQLYASNLTYSSEHKKSAPTYNIENKKAIVVKNDAVYFNVTINLETEKCMYSLVKLNPDGTMESIGIKSGFKNLNNLPLRYSFKDTSISNNNVVYELYRIGSNSELIAQWNFSAANNEINTNQIEMEITENITPLDENNDVLTD